MNSIAIRSIVASGPIAVGASVISALATDIEAFVERFAEECAQGIVSRRMADELRALLRRAQRLCRADACIRPEPTSAAPVLIDQ
jgi:hypothetical protein